MTIRFEEDDFNAFERAYYMVRDLKCMLSSPKVKNNFGLAYNELFTLEEDMRIMLNYIENHTDFGEDEDEEET